MLNRHLQRQRESAQAQLDKMLAAAPVDRAYLDMLLPKVRTLLGLLFVGFCAISTM